MEYHQDRFEDYSLLVFDKKNNLKSIFKEVGSEVWSFIELQFSTL
jgi:hypothetical protein